MGRARALYSNTTELEMIWLLKATCRVTRPVSWAESKRKRGQAGGGHPAAWCTNRGPIPVPVTGHSQPVPAHSSRPKGSTARGDLPWTPTPPGIL